MTNRPVSTLLTLALLTLVSSGTSNLTAAPTVLNGIKAVVNGEPITQTMVEQAVQTQVQVWLMGNKGQVTRAQAEREIRKMEERALDELIDTKLILSEFEKLGGVIKPQFIDAAIDDFVQTRFGGDRDKFAKGLASSGMTISQFRDVQRDQIAINALRGQQAGDTVVPNTPWEKKRVYNEIKGDYASEGKVKLRIISIPKQVPGKTLAQQESLLNQVRTELRNGADFGALAKKYSDDSFSSKGGYVGAVGRNTLASGITQVAFSLSSGQVSSPVDDGPFWRILKSEGRIGQSVPSYEKLEEEIDRRLTIEKRQKNLETWLKKLRRDANVRIYAD
ncbi:MAG: SurA N-terminal domain-containing protein [Verrucomicrobiales bacterium]|nr:SurA N-terminal domain-containing protein [Verrucomicrobiales bacterium]